MSVQEVDPGDIALPPLEITATQDAVEPLNEREAAELFARHVDHIRSHGDAVDAVRRLTNWRSGLTTKVALGALAGQVAGEAYDIYNEPLAISVAGATAIGMMGVKGIRRRLRNKRMEQARGIDTQVALGECYELYREPRRQREPTIHLRWYGGMQLDDEPHNPRPLPDSMRLMANLAEANSIEHVTLDQKFFDVLPPNAAQQPITTVGTEVRWLKTHKKLAAKKSDNQVLYNLTPTELRQVADRITNQNRVENEALGVLINRLRTVAPGSPLIQIYENLAADTQLLKAKLQPASREALERHLEVSGRQFIRTAEGLPVRQRNSPSAAINGAYIYLIGEKSFQVTPLRQALEIDPLLSEEQRQTLSPHQERRLIEWEIYELSRSSPTTVQEELDVEDKETGDESATLVELQGAIGRAANAYRSVHRWKDADGERQWLSLRWPKLRRALATLTLLGAAGYGAHIADEHETVRYNKAFSHYFAPYVKSGNYSDHALNQAVNKTRAQAPDLAIWDTILNKEQIAADYGQSLLINIFDRLPSALRIGLTPSNLNNDRPAINSAQGAELSSSYPDSNVGNIDQNGANYVDWFLHGHKMQTAGYWADTTENFLNWDGVWSRAHEGPYTVSTLPTAVPPGTPHYIAVHRDVSNYDENLTGPGMSQERIPLPVLQGTRPIAARMAGKQLHLERAADGTYSIVFPNKQYNQFEVPFTYWLGPAQPMDRPHATKRAVIYNGQARPLDPAIAANAWRSVLPHRSAQPLKRSRQEAAYIRNDFTYNLDPIPKKLAAHAGMDGVFLPSLLGVELHNIKEANCNVANTLVALDDTQLNAVIGYNNDVTPGRPDVLSTHEAHLWLVDRHGTIIDATPSGAPRSQLSYFNENTALPSTRRAPFPDKLPIMAGSLGVLLAAGAWRQRRRLDRLATNSRRRAGALMLAHATPSTLAEAIASTEITAYAPQASSERLKARTETLSIHDQPALISDIKRPHVHRAPTRRQVKQELGRGRTLKSRVLLRAADWSTKT